MIKTAVKKLNFTRPEGFFYFSLFSFSKHAAFHFVSFFLLPLQSSNYEIMLQIIVIIKKIINLMI